MSNLSDKEIDRLSREAADFYEPDDSSLSWSRLEQKLSEQMPERPPDGFSFGRFKPYVWGPAIVLLAGISFFILKNNNYSQHSTRNIQPVKQSAPSAGAVEQQTTGNLFQADSLSAANKNITATDSKNAGSPQQTVSAAGTGAKNNKTSSAKALVSEAQYADALSRAGLNKAGHSSNQLTTVTNPVSADKNSSGKVSGFKSVVPVTMAASGSLVSNGSGTNQDGLTNNLNGANTSAGINDNTGKKRDKNQLSLPAVVINGAGPGSVSGNDSLLNQQAHKKTNPNKSLRVNRSLNFGLAFGPDYTNAGGIANNQIGNNIGLTIGYYLTSKLSVNTGIFYSNKFYWSPGHGSNLSRYAPGPLQNGNTIAYAAPPPVEYVNGACNMWELPITLRYDFAKNQKTKFFANAGLSSYFMMKQTYIYFFHNGLRPAAWKTYDNKQVNYWFGVADLSMGFETEIGKGVSFQLEPFLKIPLKNMGVENRKLDSYGFLISFRYTPVLKRSKK